MSLWIGPVLLAAVVSGLISILGWFVSSWQLRRMEQLRRDEKVHDFQVALRAEIESDLDTMQVIDRPQLLETVRAHYRNDETYSVLVPHMAANQIFGAVVGEIHILPGQVIVPVVDYARLRQTVEQFVNDLRGDRFGQLKADRQMLMYADYLDMLGRLEALARRAVASLGQSLSSLGAVPSNRSSEAVSAAAASAEDGNGHS